MARKNQGVVTVPKRVYNRVQGEVQAGRERSISGTVVKALEYYLDRRQPIQEDVEWLERRIREMRQQLERSGT